MASGIHLRVLHIPGDLNYVADVILCKKFSLAQQYVPGITISSFLPPQLPLGAPKEDFIPCVFQATSQGHMNAFSESEQLPWDSLSTILLGNFTALPSTLILTLSKWTISHLIPPLKPLVFSRSICATISNSTLSPLTFWAFANNLNHIS